MPFGLAGLMLDGCGFTPLYAPGRAGTSPAQELATIDVAIIPERSGQLLRQALQARFYGEGAAVARVLELKTAFSVTSEGIAVRQDNTSTRSRVIAASAWSLMGLDPSRGTLTTGTTRVVDGYNIFDQQYFSADLAGEAATRRVAEATADRIVLQIATFFRKQAAAAS